ncbi:MAG: redoxin domain-containing protein [Alphaproteobacteria bacterium]|nr:redoxin domain-containing protein [Alphaproteobacteria bacterium]
MQGPAHEIAVGDRAPDFVLPGPDGKFYQFYERVRGRPVLLIFYPGKKSRAWGEVREFIQRSNEFDELGVDIFAVNLASTEDNKKLKLPFLVWSDVNQKITEHYLQGGGVRSDLLKTANVFLLDANQRVLALKTGVEKNLASHAYEFYKKMPKPPSSQLLSANAPVLLIPNLIDPDMCQDLMRLWKHGEHDESKVVSVVGDKEVTRTHTKVKKRRDYRIMDAGLQKMLQQTIGRRIAPELEKVFHFEGFRFDRFVVVCYDAERGDYFRIHRDNLSPTTADRAFALTLNLNVAEYEGGELVFPEYGPHKYQPISGGGILFSCSLMHEALPVRRGRRFALLTFLRTLSKNS